MSGWLEHRPLYPSDRAAHRLYLVRAPSVAAARAQFRFSILVKQARAAAEHVRPRELGRAKRQAGQIGAPLGTRRAHGGRCGDRVARSERVRTSEAHVPDASDNSYFRKYSTKIQYFVL